MYSDGLNLGRESGGGPMPPPENFSKSNQKNYFET